MCKLLLKIFDLVLRSALPEIFDEVFEKLLGKHETIKKIIISNFLGNKV